MSRILVTGGDGFIGRHVTAHLAAIGHELHVTYRNRPGTADVKWHAADLFETTAIAAEVQPEVLVHLAWYTQHGELWTAPENVTWVEASLNLLRAFAAAGGRRAIVAGTCAEYDWSGGGELLSERDTPLRPASLYGKSKLELYESATALAEQDGFELGWGRVFFLYGPDEAPERFVVSVARSLLAGKPALTTDGAQVRDFLHVNDVGAALAALATSGVTGAVNIGSGEGIALRDLATLIGEQTGRAELIEFGALPRRADDPARLVANVRRLREEVGFTPAIGLEDGVAATVAELRRNA